MVCGVLASIHLAIMPNFRLYTLDLSITHNSEPSKQVLREGLDTEKSVW